MSRRPATPIPPLNLSPQDQLTYWLLRLSEALNRLNECLLWAGSSPSDLGRMLSAPDFLGSPLATDIAHAAAAMRRFADLMFVVPDGRAADDRSVWEDLMLALRELLSACGSQSELWLICDDDMSINPLMLRELCATVYAVERLCGHFEQVH